MLTLQEIAFAVVPTPVKKMENEVPQEQLTMMCNYTPVYHEEDYTELFESAMWTPVGMECGPKRRDAAYHACGG